MIQAGRTEPRERVVVAMSGGVDSSVAAARLQDAGFDVVGVTLHLWDYPEEGAGGHGRCCAPEDQYDARRVADALGFPHYTFDRRELFAATVVQPFVDAYLAGETPSPCTACNRSVKLAELFAIADRLGASRVATGHYARIVHDIKATGTYQIEATYQPGSNIDYNPFEPGGSSTVVFNNLGGSLTFLADYYNLHGTGAMATTLDALSPNGYGAGTFLANAVPEPATWTMMLVGFFGLGAMVRSSRRKQAAATA